MTLVIRVLNPQNNTHRLLVSIALLAAAASMAAGTAALARAATDRWPYRHLTAAAIGQPVGRASLNPLLHVPGGAEEAYRLDYQYKVAGQSYRGHAEQVRTGQLSRPGPLDLSRPLEEQGRQVIVYYDPDQPALSLTHRVWWQPFAALAAVGGLVAAQLLLAALWVFRGYLRARGADAT